MIAISPLLIALVVVSTRAPRWAPSGDLAVIERSVSFVGRHPTLLGPYSRFGWHHPGPAMFFLLAPFYRLAGGASGALPVADLALGIACIVGIAVVLRRRAGNAAMVLGLAVLAAYLYTQEPGFLVDYWNPFLPMLPLLLGVLLCWSLIAGERWPLPFCLAVGTLAVQSHVGFAIGVAAVGLVTALGMAESAVRIRISVGAKAASSRPMTAWRWPIATSAAVIAVMWAPVILDQLSGKPGNLTLLLRYFRTSQPSWGYGQGLHELLSSLGTVPAVLSRTAATPAFLTPASFPVWTGVVGILCLVSATVVLLITRSRDTKPVLALTVGLSVGVVVAVAHVVGPLYVYLVPFSFIPGVLAWLIVAIAVVSIFRRIRGNRLPFLTSRLWPALMCGFFLAAAFVPLALKTVAVVPFNTPDLRPLSHAVQQWARAHPQDLVQVGGAPTRGLVGSSALVSGLFVRLEREGLPVRLAREYAISFGEPATRNVERCRWLLQVAYTDGTSAPPLARQSVLARFGRVQVYLSTLPG